VSDAPSSALTRDSTFSQRTEAVLREMILDGSIPPGERLNEVALASALGISRGPLREAIQRLAGEGLLTIISHRGAYVRTFEKREVDELYELRTAYEMHAARLVCERASNADLAQLDVFLADTGDAMIDGRYPADRDFHRRLLSLADSGALERAANDIQAQICLARTISASRPVRAKEAFDEHVDIASALQARSADDAARLVREHLDHARRSAMLALGFTEDLGKGK
jgi:DNA-binding GntR family transcriptional regulator